MSDNSFGSVIQDLYGVVSNDISNAKREINNRIDEEIQSINAQDNTISLTPIKESNELGKFINKKDNLDDIINVGNYYCANATNNINNIIQESLPESLRGNCSFRLTVMYPMDDSIIEQIIIGKVNDCIIIATRSRNIKANEWWTEWNNVFDESNAEATLEQLDKYGIHLNVAIGSVKTITAKSSQHFDVNTLVPSYETNVGDYFCNGTTAQYVDNIPITGGTASFRLFNTCDYNTGTSFAGHQTIIYNGTSELIYIRYYYNGTWYDWHKIMLDTENDHLLQLDSMQYTTEIKKPEGGALVNIGSAAYNIGNWTVGNKDLATANIDPSSVPSELLKDDGVTFNRGFRLIGMRTAKYNSTPKYFYTQILIGNPNASTSTKSDSRIYVRSKYAEADNYGPWSKFGYADDFLPFNGADYNVTEIKGSEMSKIPSFCCGAPVNLDGLISLDDIVTPGAYKSSTSTSANANVLATSAPAEARATDGTFKCGFSLQVYGNVNSKTIRQVFINNPTTIETSDIVIFYRQRHTGGTKPFGAWQRVVLSDEFYDIKNGTFNKDYRKAMSVQIGKDAQHITDLNTLIYLNETGVDNTGSYWCAINDNTQFVTNKPTNLKNGFRLFSFMGSRTYSCHQIIIENGTNYVYSRYTYYNTSTQVRTWSDWERSANKSEVEAVANNTISLDCNNYTTDLLKSDTKLAYALNVATGKIDLGYLNPGNYISRTAAAAKENIYLPSLPADMISGTDVYVGFRIEVMRSYDNTQWFQMIITNTNEPVGGYTYMYVRSASNKESPKSLTWGQWTKLLNKDDMDYEVECREAGDAEEAALRATADNALAANSYSLHPQAQGGTLITKTGETKVDLGTLLTPGTYYTPSSETATANVDPASLPEAMVGATSGNPNIGFKMNVEYVNNQSTMIVVRQTIMPNAVKTAAQSKAGLPRMYIRHRNIYGGTYVWSKWYATAFTSEVEQSANLGIDATTVTLLNKTDEDLPKIIVTESGEQVTYVDINKIAVGNYYSYYKTTTTTVKAEDNIYGAQLPNDMRDATTGKANREFKIWMLRSGTYGFTQLMFAKSTNSEKPHMYMRHAGNNTAYVTNLAWSEWQKFAFGNDLESAFLLDAVGATAIPSAANLDTYITPGNFKCGDNATVATIVNKPTDVVSPFRLTVLRTTHPDSTHLNRLYQFMIVNAAAGKDRMYFRYSFSNTVSWSSWDTIASGTKLAELQQQIQTTIKPQLDLKYDSVSYDSDTHKLTLSSTSNGASSTVKFEDIDGMGEQKFGYVEVPTEGEYKDKICFYDIAPGTPGKEAHLLYAIQGGGGGGGGGSSSVITFENLSGWVNKAFSASVSSIPFSFSWTSKIGEIPTGAGQLQIDVKGASSTETYSMSIAQGTINIDLKSFLGDESSYKVTLTVIDSQNTRRPTYLTIKLISASLEGIFDTTTPCTTQFYVRYTPHGVTSDGNKTVYFMLDSTTIATQTLDGNLQDEQQTKYIPITSAMTSGAHVLKVYFTMPVKGEALPVQSNTLEFPCFVDKGDYSDPMISSAYPSTSTIEQYNTATINYYAYWHGRQKTYIRLEYRYGTTQEWTTVSNIEAYSDLQTWNFSFIDLYNNATTTYELRIGCYSSSESSATLLSSKTFTFNVTKSEIPIHVVTENRAVYLTTTGRSNSESEAQRIIWKDNDTNVTADLTGFTFTKDNGWLTSAQDATIPEKETVLRIRNGAKCVVNYAPLYKNNFSINNGITIETKIAVSDVKDYTTNIMTILSANEEYGLIITPEDLTFSGSSNALSYQKYKTNEYITLTVAIHAKDTTSTIKPNFVYIYINGVLSNIRTYSNIEMFDHTDPNAFVIIGNTDKAVIDISRLRIYKVCLTDEQIANNYICDLSNPTKIKYLIEKNSVFQNGIPSLNILKERMPCMCVTCASDLDEAKTPFDYKMEFFNPFDITKNFTIDWGKEAEPDKHSIATQGTSSKVYKLKNFKIKFKKGELIDYSGQKKDAYQLAEGIPGSNKFTIKVNYASSEQCNNTIISMLYTDASIWKYPKMRTASSCGYDDTLRYGIYGYPICIFWRKSEKDQYSFYSIGQFNLDKGSDAYGFSEVINTPSSPEPTSGDVWYDEGGYCIEFSNNDIQIDHWNEKINADTPLSDIQRGIEYRYHYNDIEIPQSWQDVHPTFRNAINAIVDAWAQPEEDRKAAFIAAVHQHFEVDQLLYYYNFNAITMGSDQLGKNAMWAWHGGYKRRKAGETTWHTGTATKLFPMIYDSDTCLGINNQGQYYKGPSYSYELGDREIKEYDKQGEPVYGDTVWSCNDSKLFVGVQLYMDKDYTYNGTTYPGYETYYRTMRSKQTPEGKAYFSYDNINSQYEAMQEQWAEKLWNYQMNKAYVNVYLSPTEHDDRLEMLMGTKEHQRKFWLSRRIAYLDAKYYTGDSTSSHLDFRTGEAPAPTTGELNYKGVPLQRPISTDAKLYMSYVMPIWGTIQWLDTAGYDGWTRQYCRKANTTYEFPTHVTNHNQNVYAYSAQYITSIDGLGDFYPTSLDAGMCTNLKTLNLVPKLTSYATVNPNDWEKLALGTAANPLKLLETVDIRNNTGYTMDLDLSYAPSIKEVYATNTKASSIILPEAAPVKKLYYSEYTKAIEMKRLNQITDLQIPVSTTTPTVELLIIEYMNSSIFDPKTFYSEGKCKQDKGCRLALKMSSYGSRSTTMKSVISYFQDYHDKFNVLRDSSDKPRIHVDKITVNSYTGAQEAQLKELITVDEIIGDVTYGMTFYRKESATGEYSNPNTQDMGKYEDVTYVGITPTKDSTAKYTYTFIGWNKNQHATKADPDYGKSGAGWTEDQIRYPVFKAVTRQYTVTWKQPTI